MMTVDSNDKLLSQFIGFRGEVQSARACLYPLSVDLGEVQLFYLCCVMLCYVILCCFLLCYVMLCYVMLCCVMSCNVM